MLNERRVNEIATRTSQRRRTLSNITNLSLSASWASNPREEPISKTSNKSGSYLESQLREENVALKRFLAEKNATIETQAAQLDQMQKEVIVQLRRHKEVNEELISYNSRLSKDNGQVRDQLKLLQHEYSQMTVAYRVNQSELQLKLAESEELLARLLQQVDQSSTYDASPTKMHKQQRRSTTQRRRSTSTNMTILIEEDWNASSRLGSRRQQDSTRRSDLGRPSPVLRETTSGSRQTRQPADNPPAVAQRRTPSTNLYGDLIGLDPMPEGSCEDDNESPRESTSEEASSNTADESWKGENSGSVLSRESSRRTSSNTADESWKIENSGSGLSRESSRRTSCNTGDESWKGENSGNGLSRESSRRASSNIGDESWKGDKSGSGLSRESTSRGPTSSSSESASSGRRASAQFGNNPSKANQRVNSSGTRSGPVMHFSRRVPVDSSLSAENGRPLRRAVVKVVSYTEPPLNTKMRRPD